MGVIVVGRVSSKRASEPRILHGHRVGEGERVRVTDSEVEAAALCKGRNGDGNRSVFAPAGAAVTTLGVHEVAWVLRAIRDPHASAPVYSLDWKAWPPPADAPTLLLWEAFVSGAAHSASHARDAATAAVYFRDHEHALDAVNAVTTDRPLNLVHGAALWAGWASDVERLHRPCLVLKPGKPYGGAIDAA